MGKVSENLCEDKVFSKAFNMHSKEVRNFIYYKCGDMSQAEDYMQDAFIKLWDNCSKVSFAKVKSYLFVLVKNAFFNQFQHQKVVLKYKNSQKSSIDNQSPEFLMEEKEFHKQLNEEINKLTEKQREVFLMSRIDKKSYSEIADNLGISVKAVEKRMHKALKQIKENLKINKI